MDWNHVFEQGHPYQQYLDQHADDHQRQLWREMYDRIQLTPEQETLLGSWVREVRVLCMAGAWCGDCVQQCPIFEHFAQAAAVLRIHYVDRDAGPWKDELTVCGGARVPQVLFLNEDGQFVAHGGDRTLAKYRQMAATQLGGTCPTGIGAPAAELTSAVVQDWLDEFERVQWIVRLSPRLREKHGD